MITGVLPPTVASTLARVPWFGPRLLLRLQHRGLGFDAETWPGVVDMVERERPLEVSVDIYDTCLIRDLAGHYAIEHAIAHRADTEGTSGLDLAEQLERQLCRPVPGARDGLRTIRKSVGRVTFLSDTDRSADFLTSLLRSHDLFEDGDQLFCSCEQRATKAEGDLYSVIWPRPGRHLVWHVGNDPWADGTMAAAAGIRPVQVAEADLDRLESTMVRSSQGEGPVIAGAARRVRLGILEDERSGVLSSEAARARIVGAGVAGQALTAFNLWLAHQAGHAGLGKLGFLARDGELPLRMARAMPADHWHGIPLGYLHCSRLSWALASASAVGVGAWLRAGRSDTGAFLLTQCHDVPISTLLSRIGLDDHDLRRLGSKHASLAARPGSAALPVEAGGEWLALLNDDRVAETIAERSESRRSLVVDYLHGEGMLEGRVGFVDVGWRGRLAWHISSVLRSVGAADPIHFHFGGDKVIADVDRDITVRRFAFQGDGRDGDLVDYEPVQSPVVCVETLTASGKPRVVDYRRRDGGAVELVFSTDEEGDASGDGDRTDLWVGAVKVAEVIPSRHQLDEWGVRHGDLGPDVRRLLGRWWNQPNIDEVTAIAHLRFEHDEAGSAYHPLAARYSWDEVVKGAGSRRAWVRGSEMMTPRPVRLAVLLGRWIKDVLPWVTR